MKAKLVRDKIPDIIRSHGEEPKIRVLSQVEFRQKLRQKLEEEVQEYLAQPSIEELCDIQTVVEALAEQHGFSREDLQAAVEHKIAERGGFKKRILLY